MTRSYRFPTYVKAQYLNDDLGLTTNDEQPILNKINQLGDTKQLNSYIFEQHDKLRLKKRSEDPQIPERAFEMTVDNQEFQKVKKKADQD